MALFFIENSVNTSNQRSHTFWFRNPTRTPKNIVFRLRFQLWLWREIFSDSDSDSEKLRNLFYYPLQNIVFLQWFLYNSRMPWARNLRIIIHFIWPRLDLFDFVVHWSLTVSECFYCKISENASARKDVF